MRGFMFDGNFTAEQLKMKVPEDDVHLTDGDSFFTTRKPYYDHLKVALEIREVYLNLKCCKLHRNDKLVSSERVMISQLFTKPTCSNSIYSIRESGQPHVLDTAASSLTQL
jgi:hypothetical protein